AAAALPERPSGLRAAPPSARRPGTRRPDRDDATRTRRPRHHRTTKNRLNGVYSDLRRAYSPAVPALGGAAVHHAVQVLHYVHLVAYVALGIVTLLFWLRRRARPTMWAAIAFGSLGLLELLSLIPNHAGNVAERSVGRVVIA